MVLHFSNIGKSKKQADSWIVGFFISIAIRFFEKNFGWTLVRKFGWDAKKFLLCFVVTGFSGPIFSYNFHGFAKNWIIHQFKEIILKIMFCFFLSTVFISICDFNHLFWLNLITVLTFFKTNPWFDACFRFFVCIMCSFHLVI